MFHDLMHHILYISYKSMIVASTNHDVPRPRLLCFTYVLIVSGIIDLSSLYHSLVASFLNFATFKLSLHLCEVLRFLTFTIFSTCQPCEWIKFFDDLLHVCRIIFLNVGAHLICDLS